MWSEDLQISIANNDWPTYLTLCRRYNIDPTILFDVLKIKHGVIQSYTTMSIVDRDETKNLNSLAGLSFPDIKSLKIFKNFKSFDISGIKDVGFPNLEILELYIESGKLSGLESISNLKLKKLVLSGRFTNLPKISLPNLTSLSIENYHTYTSLNFLYDSWMPNLTNLSVDNPILNDSNLIFLGEIPWYQYSDLTSLKFISTKERYQRANTIIILDNRCTFKDNLNHLKLSEIYLRIDTPIIFNKLKNLECSMKTIKDFKNISLVRILSKILVNTLSGRRYNSVHYFRFFTIEQKSFITLNAYLILFFLILFIIFL